MVAPAFDGRKAVVFDDRWASAREDLAKLWLIDEGEIDADWARLSERFEGAGHVVATQANWWQGKALAAGRNVHATLYGRVAAGAENPGRGRYTDEVAVVTGASKGSIAASVVAQLLDGRRAPSSRRRRKLDDDRLAFYSTLYRDNARFGATLWVVPANMASYSDIDALVAWVGNEQTENLGPQSIHLKDAHDPDAAVPVRRAARGRRPVRGGFALRDGDEGAAVGRAAAHRRAVAHRRGPRHRAPDCTWCCPVRRTAACSAATAPTASPSRHSTRWCRGGSAESSWAQRVSLAHALIGWTKGTGLMGHNDAIVGAVEEAGVTTYTTDEMAAMLLGLCTVDARAAAARVAASRST